MGKLSAPFNMWKRALAAGSLEFVRSSPRLPEQLAWVPREDFYAGQVGGRSIHRARVFIRSEVRYVLEDYTSMRDDIVVGDVTSGVASQHA